MKKYILILLTLFSFSNLGNTVKYEYKYEMPFAPVVYQGINDSIPTIDQFGHIRNGIIAQRIIDTLNTDPGGVNLTSVEKDYIRCIVGGLYVIGVWQKCKAVYGFVGGNAWKHKWNWKDMRDVDGAFRLAFLGGVTHNFNGVQFDGSTGYANTFFNPSISLVNTSTHISAYIKSSSNSTSTTNPYVSGISGFASSDLFGLLNRAQGGFIKGYQSSNPSTTDFVYNTNNTSPMLGYLLGTLNSGIISFWNKGEKQTIQSQGSFGSTLPNANLPIGCQFSVTDNTAILFDNKLINMFSVGSGLTDQQAIQASNIVTFSQGILGRK